MDLFVYFVKENRYSKWSSGRLLTLTLNVLLNILMKFKINLAFPISCQVLQGRKSPKASVRLKLLLKLVHVSN